MKKDKFKIETTCIHGGYVAGNGEPQVLPIAQSTTFRYTDPNQLAKLFNLKELGPIYSRIGNPTVDCLEKKCAELEGGVAAVAFASGMAAITAAIFTIADSGDHIVAANNLYGGTYTLFSSTFKKLGIDVSFVDPASKAEKIEKLIKPNTKVIYAETIGNPALDVLDFDKFAAISKKHRIVLMIDNTLATPIICKPLSLGADIVVHSSTKYMDGHATALSGVVVDGGNFDWEASGRYPALCKPDPTYHGEVFVKSFGNLAYIIKVRVQILRDLGAALSPFNAFLVHNGLETLHLRMERHSTNAQTIAKWLASNQKVAWVKYPLLEGGSNYPIAKKYLAHLGSGVISFGLKSGYEGATSFMENLSLISVLAHVGDLRTCVLHPASTSHRQMSADELATAGISQDFIRMSVGLESVDDIIVDLDKAIEKT